MTDEQKKRLEIRVVTCRNEIEDAQSALARAGHNLKFWKNELSAAQAELIGMQLSLNLRCSTCGD
nr:MAG: hypothetical protein [Microviridae sp.]